VKNLNLKNISTCYKVAAVGWFSRFVMGFSQIISISILLDYLGTNLYAVFSIITGLQGWFLLADCGLGSSLQNYISEVRVKKNDIDHLLCNATIAIVIILVASLLLFTAVSPLLQYFLFHSIEPSLASSKYYILLVIGWIYILTTIASIAYRVFFANHKGHISYFYQTIGPIFSVLAIFLLKYVKISTNDRLFLGLLCWILPNFIVAMAAYLQVFPKKGLISQFDFRVVRELLLRGLNFWGFALSATLTLCMDYIVMAQTLSAKEITMYNILFKGFSLILFIYSAILTAIWPEIAELFMQKQWVKANLVLKKNIFIGLLFVVFCTLIFLLFKGAIITILAPDANITLPCMPIIFFGIYCVIRVWTDTYSVALQSQNYLKIFWVCVPIQAVLSVVGMYFLSLKMGLSGVLLGLIISFVLTTAWGVPIFYYKRKSVYN
jgi:O-antigen/teichoic acid export membrane protein